MLVLCSCARLLNVSAQKTISGVAAAGKIRNQSAIRAPPTAKLRQTPIIWREPRPPEQETATRAANNVLLFRHRRHAGQPALRVRVRHGETGRRWRGALRRAGAAHEPVHRAQQPGYRRGGAVGEWADVCPTGGLQFKILTSANLAIAGISSASIDSTRITSRAGLPAAVSLSNPAPNTVPLPSRHTFLNTYTTITTS